MRTKYFRESALSDDGKKNVKALASLPVEAVTYILNWLGNRKTYPRLDMADRLELAQLTGESGDTLVPSLSILKLFIDRLVSHGDDVGDFYADLKDLDVIEEGTSYDTLDIVFSRLPGITANFRLLRRRILTEGFGMPFLTGSSYTPAIKPVLQKSFEYGVDEISTYKPAPIGFTVVAQVELQNSDSGHIFAFQVNRDNFDRLIADLLALQAQMKLMEAEAEHLTAKYLEK